ncbi:DUF969 domain-containing protein [Burkholderia multivorans]|uniref:5-oxoproline transporter, DUF969 family subunit n=1 Tax=Burkholderia multivorans TaxID=87883 RepID=UPI00201ADF9C|nr:DUF969 family protein [Burkholderia multivorans]MCL4665201.1 DUF969 domain-containing protein [Burkholderia multivorans]
MIGFALPLQRAAGGDPSRGSRRGSRPESASSTSSARSARRSPTTATWGLIWLTLPVIALLERNGLKGAGEADDPPRVHAATTGRVLMLYFVLRQATAALGLHVARRPRADGAAR